MDKWQLIIDPPEDPSANMARDEKLAKRVREGVQPPTLRVYEWSEPCISLGRRQNPEDLPAELIARGLPIVRRPTGGGAVVHRLDELTYTLAMPPRLLPPGIRLHQLPGLLHEKLQSALLNSGLISSEALALVHAECLTTTPSLCFASPVCGDLLYRGEKVAGLSLRAWRECLLLQGSIQGLPVPYDELLDTLAFAVEESFQG